MIKLLAYVPESGDAVYEDETGVFHYKGITKVSSSESKDNICSLVNKGGFWVADLDFNSLESMHQFLMEKVVESHPKLTKEEHDFRLKWLLQHSPKEIALEKLYQALEESWPKLDELLDILKSHKDEEVRDFIKYLRG